MVTIRLPYRPPMWQPASRPFTRKASRKGKREEVLFPLLVSYNIESLVTGYPCGSMSIHVNYVPLVISCVDKYLFSSLIITLQNTVVQETLKRLGAQLQAKVLNELNVKLYTYIWLK